MKIAGNTGKILLIAAAVAAMAGCKKDDDETETLPSLSGSLRFNVEEYLGKKATVVIEPTGVTHPEGKGIGYSCSASWLDESITLKEEGSDSFIEENKTLTLPDEIGTYTISCTASASGYYSTTSTKYVTVVDPAENETLKDMQKGYDSVTYPEGAGVTDRDGNEYRTVTIGQYEWMASNLAYKGKGLEEAGTITDSLGIAYANCDAMSDIFGRYYTWEEISSTEYNICPDGWEVPDAGAWMDMANTLSGNKFTDAIAPFEGIAGKMMVDAQFNAEDNFMWEYEPWMNSGMEDGGLSGVSGLAVIPCGFASISLQGIYDTSDPDKEPETVKVGSFDSAFSYAAFWMAPDAGSAADGDKAYYRYIHNMTNSLQINSAPKDSFGASVRCVRKNP